MHTEDKAILILTSCYICLLESFNGSLRDECLNTHWFESIEDAKVCIEAWRLDYNESRPHMALRGITPQGFARQ